MALLHATTDKGEADAMSSLRRSGADLSNYQEQLIRERNTRSLTLRRQSRSRVSISAVLNRSNTANDQLNVSNYPFLDPDKAMATLASGNPKSVGDMMQNIIVLVRQSKRHIDPLMANDDFAAALVAAVNDGDEQLSVIMMETLAVLFPFFPERHEFWVDEGLTMMFCDVFEGGSIKKMDAALDLISSISEASGYARDSILCLGIHTVMIETALKDVPQEICLKICEALMKVFANKQAIDTTTMNSCVDDMAKLLTLPYPNCVFAAVGCFVEMTNKAPVIVFAMYDLGLFPVIVSMLNVEQLVPVALPLIGNMSVGHAQHVQKFLECDLFDRLMKLIQTEYVADVFWVLSNLVESVPHLTVGLFNASFIAATIDIAESASYDVKKEGTFFLATLILFTESADLKYFMTGEVLELMVQILDCSIALMVLRVLDALIRLARSLEMGFANDELRQMLQGSTLYDSLQSCLDSSFVIRERAEFLLNLLDSADSPLCGS